VAVISKRPVDTKGAKRIVRLFISAIPVRIKYFEGDKFIMF
jgi:hypothetical protein